MPPGRAVTPIFHQFRVGKSSRVQLRYTCDVTTTPPVKQTPAVERRIRQLGHDIFERARAAEPSPLRMAFWQRRMLDWIMEDEPLKLQLFRFIEALPRLHDSETV